MELCKLSNNDIRSTCVLANTISHNKNMLPIEKSNKYDFIINIQ